VHLRCLHFWDVARRIIVVICRHSKTTYRVKLKGHAVFFDLRFAKKMQGIASCETLSFFTRILAPCIWSLWISITLLRIFISYGSSATSSGRGVLLFQKIFNIIIRIYETLSISLEIYTRTCVIKKYIIIISSQVHSFSCFDGYLLLEIGGPCVTFYVDKLVTSAV